MDYEWIRDRIEKQLSADADVVLDDIRDSVRRIQSGGHGNPKSARNLNQFSDNQTVVFNSTDASGVRNAGHKEIADIVRAEHENAHMLTIDTLAELLVQQRIK